MGSNHSKYDAPPSQDRSVSLPRKNNGLKARLSSMKTGSLKRIHTLRSKDHPTATEEPVITGRRWNSECSLITEKGRRHGPVVEEDLQLVPTRAEEIPEEERGTCFVNLMKTEGSVMGLTLSGGADKDGRPRVSNLRSSGIAAKSDQLQVGDYITAVNGIRTSKLKHCEIISLLKNIGEKVSLEIEYHLPPTTVQTASIIQKTTDITLKKEDGSFGFVLRGGGHEQHRKTRPLVVTHMRPDSCADKEGSLKTGDRIIAVGTTPIKSLCLEEATSLIQHCGDEAIFTFEYDVSVMDAVANASGPLLVEVSKTPGAELGITLAKSTHRKKPVLCIDRVRPASISDRCGALHIGDQILSIDNVSMGNGAVSVREASEMLSSASDQVRLEILPVSHLAIASSKQFGQNRFAPVITSAQSMSALNSQRVGGSRYPTGNTIAGYGRGGNRWARRRMQRPKYSASAMSLVSTDYLSGNQVVHTEVIEVHLLTAEDGCDLVTSSSSLPNFGIQLQGSVFATEILNSTPLIGYIEPDRAADRCGVLQAGDRIISINGYPCDECSVDEVNQLLSDAYYSGQVVLEIEFDVAESVVPSSGTFHAKLPKRRGVNLGIVVGSASCSHPGHALMISEVRRGSVAHRTGTLEAGDRLLAIDGVRLDECTPDDAHALLASAEDVVRLKIQKDEENSDDTETSNIISYTVELKRYGGPLGITISGTEEPFDPIVISGLTPGGLAARTGAIHEGDKIQSINNISLRAKPLSEAINLLQNAGELVTLKIKRQLSEPEDRMQATPKITPSRKSPFSPVATTPNPLLNEPISELSDPEDDILPPPMGPLSDHMPFSDPTSTPKPGTPLIVPPVPPKDRGVRPGPAGAPSVDSAVESWEDSSADMHWTRSSTGSHQHTPLSPILQESASPHLYPHQFTSNLASLPRRQQQQSATMSRLQKRSDPGARNVDQLRAKFEAASSRTYSDTWGTREQIRARTIKSPERSRAPMVADWQRALEDLQSVGQSTGFLRDLESNLTLDSDDIGRHTNTYRRLPPSDEYNQRRQPPGGSMYDMSHRRDYNPKVQAVPSVPQKLLRLTLFKDNLNEDFGFSMSDGQIESGVYVHTVRPGGPAGRAGVLPFDRVLQVNGASTHDTTCSMAVPLVASAQTRLELLVSRNPGNAATMATHHQGRPILTPPVHLGSRGMQADNFPTL